MINKHMFTSGPVILATLVLLLVAAWDFHTRVWFPIDSQQADERSQDTWSGSDAWHYDSLPEHLAAWFNAEQQRLAEAEREQEAQQQQAEAVNESVPPLAGATSLGSIRLRVRGVFNRQSDDRPNIRIAIAEQQNKESGQVTLLTLREGNKIDGFEVVNILPGSVELSPPDGRESMVVNVFEFKSANQ